MTRAQREVLNRAMWEERLEIWWPVFMFLLALVSELALYAGYWEPGPLREGIVVQVSGSRLHPDQVTVDLDQGERVFLAKVRRAVATYQRVVLREQNHSVYGWKRLVLVPVTDMPPSAGPRGNAHSVAISMLDDRID